MRARTLRFLAVALLSASLLLPIAAPNTTAADTDQVVLQADRKFVQAASLQNGSLLARMLDDDFTWTDADGKTLTFAEVLHSVPKPILGDESGIDVTQRTYGQVGAVQASRGKIHILRMWVQRPGGWRLLVYHEVKQLDQPSNSPGSGVKDCENPCKMVPFKPANEAEQAIIASWQALETGVTAHDADAWAPHIADEFVQISSNSDHVISKAGRIETLNKQKASAVGSAPAPLVSAKMFDFGDAMIMTCLHQPYSGKPIHVSRLWIKRDGKWIMSISYQTTIQAAAAK
jgi:hypothetical protein